jgi:hypothetical protein
MAEKNTIPLKEAQDWAKRWTSVESEYNRHHELHAFLIPTIDLQEVLCENPDAIRAYIGVEKTADGQFIEKLMIVGTRFNTKTGIYEDLITNPGSTSLDDGLEGDIYDFTQPCPTTCDPKSPLNF